MPQASAQHGHASRTGGLEITRRKVERVEGHADLMRFEYQVRYPDGLELTAIISACGDGRLVDIQAEHPGWFLAGSTGDPALDSALTNRVRAFLDARRHLLALGARP